MADTGYDWERFWIHFVFGALFGLFMWFVLLSRFTTFGLASWPGACIFSLAMAVLGGVFGDRFWIWFLENLRWLH
jgi:hypothetical protein